jgi:hypothetical protein
VQRVFYFPIEPKLRELMKLPKYKDMCEHEFTRPHNDMYITDVYDSPGSGLVECDKATCYNIINEVPLPFHHHHCFCSVEECDGPTCIAYEKDWLIVLRGWYSSIFIRDLKSQARRVHEPFPAAGSP